MSRMVVMAALGLAFLGGCGDKDDDGFGTVNAGGGSGGSTDTGVWDLYPEDLGYDYDGWWVRMDPDYEGPTGFSAFFGCATTADGIYEVEGEVETGDSTWYRARLYFAEEPSIDEVFDLSDAAELNVNGVPSSVAAGTAVLFTLKGSSPDQIIHQSTEGTVLVTTNDRGTAPRFVWRDAALTHVDDGSAAVSEGGHIKCTD